MNLNEILRFLDIKREKFADLTKENWNRLFAEKLTGVTDTKKKQQWATIGNNLSEQANRQQVLTFEAQSQKYEHLYIATPGTPAYKSKEAEKAAITDESSNIATSSTDGGPTSNYNIAGDKPEKIAENKAIILALYKNYIIANYLEDEREKHQPKHEIFNTFEALKASPTFSTLTLEDQKGYEAVKDNFPMKITTLPFKTPEEGKNFMKSMENQNYLKSPAEIAEEQAKKTVEATTLLSSTPSLSLH